MPDSSLGEVHHLQNVLAASRVVEIPRIEREPQIGNLVQKALEVLCVRAAVRRSTEVLDRDRDAALLRFRDELLHVRKNPLELVGIVLPVGETWRHDHDARHAKFRSARQTRLWRKRIRAFLAIEPIREIVEVYGLQPGRGKFVEIRFCRSSVESPDANVI